MFACILWCRTQACPDNGHSAQVIPMLIRSGHRRDYLIMNFGLHYTEDYKGELQTMVEQVSSPGLWTGHRKADVAGGPYLGCLAHWRITRAVCHHWCCTEEQRASCCQLLHAQTVPGRASCTVTHSSTGNSQWALSLDLNCQPGMHTKLAPDGGRRARQTRALRATGDFPVVLSQMTNLNPANPCFGGH